MIDVLIDDGVILLGGRMSNKTVDFSSDDQLNKGVTFEIMKHEYLLSSLYYPYSDDYSVLYGL